MNSNVWTFDEKSESNIRCLNIFRLNIIQKALIFIKIVSQCQHSYFIPGEQNGYNIPEMVAVPDLPLWLSDEGARQLNEKATNDKMLPEHAKRLLCDAYMCMYQSTDVMMYR